MMQASSSASERANSFKSLRNFRGRTVVLVFSNQGLGNLVNTAIILALMAITGQYGPKYNASKHLFLALLSIDSPSDLAIWSSLQSPLPSLNAQWCSAGAIEIVWRVQYAIITAVIGFMLLWRIFGLKENPHFRKRSGVHSSNHPSMMRYNEVGTTSAPCLIYS